MSDPQENSRKKQKGKKFSKNNKFLISSGALIGIISISFILTANDMKHDGLSKEKEQLEETVKEPTYLDQKVLAAQLKSEKRHAQADLHANEEPQKIKSSLADENKKEELPEDKTAPEPAQQSASKPQQESKPGTKPDTEAPEQVADFTTAFDFSLSTILANGEAFLNSAGKGGIFGTDYKIGMDFFKLKESFGEPDFEGTVPEGGYALGYGDYYLITGYNEEDVIRSIDIRSTEKITIEQVVGSLGEPYYSFNEMIGNVVLTYYFDDYLLYFETEGLHEIENPSQPKLTGIDMGAEITWVNLWPNKDGAQQPPTQNIKKISDLETLDFQDKWFNEAKKIASTLPKVKEIVMNGEDRYLTFTVSVVERTNEEETKKIAHAFLKQLTESANSDIQQTHPNDSIWNHYKYMIHFDHENDENARYYQKVIPKEPHTINDSGYLEMRIL
jgi:hypothetical protein